MYARVARFEGGEAEALRRVAKEVNDMAASEGPPPGVPAVGYLMLIDPDSGRSLGIGLFETEEDLRKGDAALNDMSPSGPDVGKRSTVEIYEVGADLRMPATSA
jgi:hypothetical protein